MGVGNDNDFSYFSASLLLEQKPQENIKKKFSVFILYLSKGRKKAKQRENVHQKKDEKDISCVLVVRRKGDGYLCEKEGKSIRNVFLWVWGG